MPASYRAATIAMWSGLWAIGAVALREARAQAITDAFVVGPMLAALSVAVATLIQVLRIRS